MFTFMYLFYIVKIRLNLILLNKMEENNLSIEHNLRIDAIYKFWLGNSMQKDDWLENNQKYSKFWFAGGSEVDDKSGIYLKRI